MRAVFSSFFATLDLSLGYKGITAVVLEKGTPGFSVGKKEDKLGIRASSTCELVFQDCIVPADAVLGEPGKSQVISALKFSSRSGPDRQCPVYQHAAISQALDSLKP